MKMTRKLVLMTFLFSGTVFAALSGGAASSAEAADSRPYPGHQCMGECTPSVLKIWNDFEAGQALNSSVADQVYSGECHMKGVSYDSEDVHHGVVYFSPNNGALHFEGRFTFFGSGNPYANWTEADAIRELQPKNDPLSLITFDESFAWVDFHPNQVPMMQYYFRKSSSDESIKVVGIFGEKHTLFCSLNANPTKAQ